MINILSNKGFNENELVAFSEKVGYELPDDYIEFLRKHNGGYVEDSVSTYYRHGEQKFILTSMFGLGSEDDLFTQFESFKNRIPNTCISIGRDAGGNLVCLNLSQFKYGYVYFWDHEEELNYEDGKITINDLYFIADSFKDFLNSIERYTINESDLEGYEVKEVWIDPDFLKELENKSDK
ncbi:SMI1/KNR4 family protein [Aquisalibacillus elongatus]|uniref:SMI1/KNR4 family protein SUKH-1 n=1 Tax=Aquisalibacillus elongatus TaxID=485577 RepID=A0A3N5BB41_9BACI|nr:SMI1/KNR4 family protein [Aquisalibacillus elongatus]RPF54169.1 SMI1/KNR4 family protein SUKH-1 [Aquisalibacillus elongatus]